MEVIDEKEDLFYFGLMVTDEIKVEIMIHNTKAGWGWLFAGIKGLTKWHFFNLINDNFVPDTNKTFFLEEEIEQINKGLYELLKQIKQNKHYRLKVLNTLSEQNKKLWELL